MVAREEVLIIDSDSNSNAGLSQILAHLGYHSRACTQFSDALEEARLRSFLAVFVDICRIDVSDHGIATLRGMYPVVPIIAASYESDTSRVLAAIRAGATDFLLKPIDHCAVEDVLNRAFVCTEDGIDRTMGVIAGRLRDTRNRLGIKQAVVAMRAGLSTAQICQIENASSAPSLTSLLRITRALRTSLSEIVRGL